MDRIGMGRERPPWRSETIAHCAILACQGYCRAIIPDRQGRRSLQGHPPSADDPCQCQDAASQREEAGGFGDDILPKNGFFAV